MKPDRQRILDYFRNNPNREINAYREIVGADGLRILEYTGRITDARKMIGCTCASTNPIPCKAKEHIVNTRKGYYMYKSDQSTDRIRTMKSEPILEVKLDNKQLEQKLEELRNAYRREKSPVKRRLIEISANNIKQMINENNNLVKNVKDALL